MLKSLQDVIFKTDDAFSYREEDLRQVHPFRAPEQYNNQVALTLATLRLATWQDDFEMVQWCQSKISDWSASVRLEVMHSFCCDPDVNLFKLIAKIGKTKAELKPWS